MQFLETYRYIVASLALGAIAVWASENFFRVASPADLTALEWVLTVGVYSLASASALTAIAVTGFGGLSAAFLGGAIMGYLIEGAIVATIYDAFPFQLVWAPLAWHALISGGVVLGLGRCSARFGPFKMALIWLTLGLLGGAWALFWPTERADLPGVWSLMAYLLGLGLVVPAAHLALDKIAVVPRPPRWVLAVAPVCMLISWMLQTGVSLNPLRLVLLPILAGLCWIMRRLGAGQAVSFGTPAKRLWHHALFLITPFTTAVIAALGWANISGIPTNILVALVTYAVSLGWLGRLVWRAARV